MYYNIKIKSNGSEFSLESNSKEITQREMDLYFAGIFSASEEFKSKIKKIEITNKNVKSINILEKQNTQTDFSNNVILTSKETSTPIANEPLTNINEIARENTPNTTPTAIEEFFASKTTSQDEIQPTPTLPYETDSDIHNLLSKSSEINITTTNNTSENSYIIEEEPTIEQIQTFINTPEQDEVLTQNLVSISTSKTPEENKETSKIKTKEESLQENNIENLSQMAPIPQNEIDELISIAQKKLDLVDTNSKIESILFPNEKSNNLERLTQNTKKGIKMAAASHEEQKIAFENNNQAKLNDIFNSVPTSEVPATLAPETLIVQEIVEAPTTIATDIQEDMLTIDATEFSKSKLTTDFNQFLSDYKTRDLSNQFVICAYFIKHALRQPNFTIKFINSKLFPATGKIADMAIVDDLIKKEYIKMIETSNSKVYCITQNGEMYFDNLY